jgi:hypothetical protein
MNLKRLILLGTLLIGGIISAPATATANSFYSSKVEVQTPSWQNCMRWRLKLLQGGSLSRAVRRFSDAARFGRLAKPTASEFRRYDHV